MLVYGGDLHIAATGQLRNVPPVDSNITSIIHLHINADELGFYFTGGVGDGGSIAQRFQKERKFVGIIFVVCYRWLIGHCRIIRLSIKLFRCHQKRDVYRFVPWLNVEHDSRMVTQLIVAGKIFIHIAIAGRYIHTFLNTLFVKPIVTNQFVYTRRSTGNISRSNYHPIRKFWHDFRHQIGKHANLLIGSISKFGTARMHCHTRTYQHFRD